MRKMAVEAMLGWRHSENRDAMEGAMLWGAIGKREKRDVVASIVPQTPVAVVEPSANKPPKAQGLLSLPVLCCWFLKTSRRLDVRKRAIVSIELDRDRALPSTVI